MNVIGNTEVITKAQLRKDIVPIVRAWLCENGYAETLRWSGHRIYTHATKGEYRASIVYEGTEWAYDFCDEIAGVISTDNDEFEVDPNNSYEINIGRWSDGRH